MELRAGARLLNAQFQLEGEPRPVDGQSAAQVWLARDLSRDIECLVKIWPIKGREAEGAMRALWDAELRTLYRLASSPHADELLVRLKYAAVDRASECFAMVLDTPSTLPLASLMRGTERPAVEWLDTRHTETRRRLWQGLRTVVDGIRLLHKQRVLHRSIGPESVYCDPDTGPESLRLGGFEWSVRLGEPAGTAPPDRWSTPPEFYSPDAKLRGYSPETDWYAFGMLAIRLLVPHVAAYDKFMPPERHARILQAVRGANQVHLSATERDVLLGLIDRDPRSRRSDEQDVVADVDRVVTTLMEERDGTNDARRLVLVFNPNRDADKKVHDTLVAAGTVTPPANESGRLEPADYRQIDRVLTALREDFAAASVYPCSARGDSYLLLGETLCLRIGSYSLPGERPDGWEYAQIRSIAVLNDNQRKRAPVRLPAGAVYTCQSDTVRRDGQVRRNARNWRPFLPRVDRTVDLSHDLERYHDLIRCTSQIEIPIRAAEIFPYVIVERRTSPAGVPIVRVREGSRTRNLPTWCKPSSLLEYIRDQLDAGKKDGDVFLVYADPDNDDPFVAPKSEESGTRKWRLVGHPDETSGELELQPEQHSALGSRPLADSGSLRPVGLGGQITLMIRRQDAIARLREHSYLLKALASTVDAYMDTGEVASPLAGLPDSAFSVDKRAVVRDIFRVRPIYTLQGPPGTGKSTLVAHLVRAILTEDPVAQILITAPENEAVDVLREKVRHDAYADADDDALPLAIRLRKKEDTVDDDGSVARTAERQLQFACAALDSDEEAGGLTPLQHEWRNEVRGMLAPADAHTRDSDVRNFEALVALSANITYCTTTAGNLEELAKGEQSFDWTIVEESGKSHGFDLALPLQSGHRWLMIGDQFQLKPYLIEKYRDALNHLDATVEWIARLPRSVTKFRDDDWIQDWRNRTPSAKQEFISYAIGKLDAFDAVFRSCKRVRGGDPEMTGVDEENGSAAGQLTYIHRMHPTIVGLVSSVFYEGYGRSLIAARSADDAKVRHPFTAPSAIRSRPIVWLDVPLPIGEWFNRQNGEEAAAIEQLLTLLTPGDVPVADLPKGEKLDLAVLAPYRAQVALLNEHFRHFKPPFWAAPKRRARDAHRARSGAERSDRVVAHTIDAFQGNQAHVVVVSLTKNTPQTDPDAKTIEFLNRFRTNVLASRASALLVLVGSWEFFTRQVERIDPADRNREMWHWRAMIDHLAQLFASGEAVKVTVADLRK